MPLQCCPKLSTGHGVVCGGAADVEIAGDAYDGFETVLPLDETSAGTLDEFKDRTRKHHDGTGKGILPTVDDGVFCLPSQHFTGAGWIAVDPDDLTTHQSFSVSLWARTETWYRTRAWFSRGSFKLGHNFLNHIEATLDTLTTDQQTKTHEVMASSVLEQDRFYHVGAVWDRQAGKLKVYQNGVLSGSTDIEELETVGDTESYLARYRNASYPTGNLQEFRLHPVARTTAWMLAEYDNVCHADEFYSVSDPSPSTYS